MLAALITDTHYGFDHNTERHHTKTLKRLKKDMDNKGCNLLLHTGDWSTCRQRQLHRTLEMFRETLGHKTIIATTMGNHEIWLDTSEEIYLLSELIELHKTWLEEFEIHYLDSSSLICGDSLFLGFDGWYANPEIHKHTNDIKWMPTQLGDLPGVDAHDAMRRRAEKSFQTFLDLMDREDLVEKEHRLKIVALSHFPLFEGIYNGNPSWLEFMTEKCDTICFGHSHKKMDITVGKSRIYNAGSDYNNIRYQFIEV